jgi:hypothetical protein
MATKQAITNLVDELREDQPYRRECQLTHNSGSVQAVLFKRAILDAGRDPENPGTARQLYYPQEAVVVIDLDPEGDG